MLIEDLQGLFPFPDPSQVNCWLHYSAEYGANASSPYYDSAVLIDSVYTRKRAVLPIGE